jgi:drug/metabolite transporter (DMT)-like permease
LITVMIWGTTFVSTKYLINNGIGPIEIMVFRFFI